MIEYILRLDLGLSFLLPTLKSIKELFIVGVDDKTFVAMLRDFQLSLRVADISLVSDAETDDLEDILPFFANSSFGLQKLELIRSEIAHATIQYPHLRTLTLWESYVENMGNLLHSFPNLCNLTIINDVEDHYSWMRSEEQEQLHRSNRESQLNRSWPDLDYVRSTNNIVYTLGLVCKIHHLDLGTIASSKCIKLTSVISDTRPSCLEMRLEFNTGSFQPNALTDILRVLRS
ncbi:hypothetical protein AcW2_005276 [Taiwanofungus camphoratus]|nr:hypothetical protein AcW2_005276 [Antrodia cinnamomea]